VSSSTTGTPTGTVTFTSGGTTLGSPALVNGIASVTISNFAIGATQVAVSYSGDTNFNSSSGSATATISPTQNVWVGNQGNASISQFTHAGAPAVSIGAGGFGIAIDSTGSVWSLSQATNSLLRLSNTGTNPATFTGGGLNQPVALSIDGSGSVWIVNVNSSVSTFSNTGTPLTPGSSITGGGLSSPGGIAIDPSGNVWVANSGNNSLTEFLGAADPVTSPLSVATQNATQATKP
jgi:streptogramin lyase